MTDKRSLIILGRFPPPHDGQSIQTARFASLMRENFEIAPVSSSVSEESGLVSKVRQYTQVGRTLAEELSQHRDAVLIWESISPQFLGHMRDIRTVLRHARGRKIIAVVHWGNFARLFSSPLTRRSAHALIHDVSRFVFNDSTLSEACRQWIAGSKRVVIPNAADDAVVASDAEIDRKRDTHGDSPIRLLFLSNMIESKGYLDVVRAARLLVDRGVAFQLDMVGHWYRSEDKDHFDEMIREMDLADYVSHHGVVSDRKRIKEFHLSADVFLLPTYYPIEAQPVSIIEALSAATPVVTTTQGGIPCMITDNHNGLIIPPKDPEALAEAINRLTDRSLWASLSQNARDRFLATYHADVIREHWSAVIAEAEKE